jgi:hypothetical protein
MLIILFLVLLCFLSIILLEISEGIPVTETFSDNKTVTGIFVYNSLLAKLLLRKRFIAITLGKYVFVKGYEIPFTTTLHELRHVLQWRELGIVNFLYQYLKEHYKHGYKCNKFEEEARAFAGQNLRCPRTTS